MFPFQSAKWSVWMAWIMVNEAKGKPHFFPSMWRQFTFKSFNAGNPMISFCVVLLWYIFIFGFVTTHNRSSLVISFFWTLWFIVYLVHYYINSLYLSVLKIKVFITTLGSLIYRIDLSVIKIHICTSKCILPATQVKVLFLLIYVHIKRFPWLFAV